MPVQYGKSVLDSSVHCRQAALLFDVSHMCGLSLKVLVGSGGRNALICFSGIC